MTQPANLDSLFRKFLVERDPGGFRLAESAHAWGAEKLDILVCLLWSSFVWSTRCLHRCRGALPLISPPLVVPVGERRS
jgi:hypothetical protein